MSCLKSIFSQVNQNFEFTIYLIDNGSDGTHEKVSIIFPQVKLILGDNKLYWAGSMRRIWQHAINTSINYDYFLLLNDDTILMNTAFSSLGNDITKLASKEVILIGSTIDPVTKNISYGGSVLLNNYSTLMKKIIPNNNYPQLCHLGNANIMLVPTEVVKEIGILSDLYTHGIADYDYTLSARKRNIPTFIGSKYMGFCEYDHGNKWWPAKKFTLKQRIKNLYDVKGLAYKEYLMFVKIHFPYYLPQAFILLWGKTLFPFLWEKFKKKG
ncbi:MAG: glycosyltransferase family 2 protein [Bacteroidota bacterium]|nr:glycosyltransferase family 2 protein [Bacteroidota bacterium]